MRLDAAAKKAAGDKTRKRAAAHGGKKANGQKMGGRRPLSISGRKIKPRTRG